MRQVAYALLTRPPLSIYSLFRRFAYRFLARLACVRHAASVHPEPGSNSLLNGILLVFPLHLTFTDRLRVERDKIESLTQAKRVCVLLIL